MTMLESVSEAVPVFVRVNIWAALLLPTGALLKLMLVGERDAMGARPAPPSNTACGLPVALSAIVRDALRFPIASGVKLISMVQLAPTATELLHVLVCAKSPLFIPATTMLAMESAA